MGKLPFSECDVLICDRIGKNISGTGMDTNIIGRNVRGFTQGQPWCDGMPGIHRIFIRSLTSETEGNAIGMGLAEFSTTRFAETINTEYSQLNSFTACSPLGVQMPAILPNDRLGIQMAIRTCGYRDRGFKVCFIRDTLSLESIYLSEQFLQEEETMALVEPLADPEPLTFDTDGWLQSPFAN